MKKSIFLTLALMICGLSFAQIPQRNANSPKTGNPAVTVEQVSVSNTTFSVRCTPNEECASYKILAMTDEDIAMWESRMGSVEYMIDSWGLQLSGDTVYTYNDMQAETTYKVMVRPYDAAGTGYDYSYINVTTILGGGTGEAIITVEVSNITDSSALVSFIPNESTALFYDGIITKAFVESVGRDSACNILYTDPQSLFYETDTWEWTTLDPGTAYYAIAFGKNGNGEFGDTVFYEFQTLGDGVGINNMEYQPIAVYPIPNNGTFVVAGEKLQGSTAQIYSMTGQLMKRATLSSATTQVSTQLPTGSYLLRVMDKNNQPQGSTTIIVQ